MHDAPKHDPPRTSWANGVIWMGANLPGLVRLLARNRFRVSLGRGPGCAFDLGCGLVNSGLGAIQRLALQPRVDRAAMDDRPLFIIGHWRTGTTLLHELLALDPRNRCPTTFECFLPNHFLLTEKLLKGWTGFILPGRRPSDAMEMGWDRPQEDEFALCNLGIPSPYLSIAFPNQGPLFEEYYDLEQLDDAQRRRWQTALLRFHKQLVWKKPGRLVLKSPTHTFRLPLLKQMYPRAAFLHIVRDPFAVFPSTVRLWKSLHEAHGYQNPTHAGLEERVYETFSRMHARLLATRGLIDPNRFCELRYEDLVRDPVGQLRMVYERLSLGEYTVVEPAIRAYAAGHADYRTNQYGLSPEQRREIAHRWKPYFDAYGYDAKGGVGSQANG